MSCFRKILIQDGNKQDGGSCIEWEMRTAEYNGKQQPRRQMLFPKHRVEFTNEGTIMFNIIINEATIYLRKIDHKSSNVKVIHKTVDHDPVYFFIDNTLYFMSRTLCWKLKSRSSDMIYVSNEYANYMDLSVYFSDGTLINGDDNTDQTLQPLVEHTNIDNSAFAKIARMMINRRNATVVRDTKVVTPCVKCK